MSTSRQGVRIPQKVKQPRQLCARSPRPPQPGTVLVAPSGQQQAGRKGVLSPPHKGRAAARRTLAAHSFSRSSSLNEKKVSGPWRRAAPAGAAAGRKEAACNCPVQVLLATDLKRSPSLLQPALFSFQDHFVFEELIGRSRLSEASWLCRIACAAVATFEPRGSSYAGLACAAQSDGRAVCGEEAAAHLPLPCAS